MGVGDSSMSVSCGLGGEVSDLGCVPSGDSSIAGSWSSGVSSRIDFGGEAAARKPKGVMLAVRALERAGVTTFWLC